MAKVKCKICSEIILDKESCIKSGNRYICPNCIDEYNKTETEKTNKPKSDYSLLLDYITELYGGSSEVNYPFITIQIKRFVEDYQMKYTGILLSLKYYTEIEEQQFDRQYGLGGIVPKYYHIAKNHFKKVKQLEKEVKDLVIVENISVVKICIDNSRKIRYTGEELSMD